MTRSIEKSIYSTRAVLTAGVDDWDPKKMIWEIFGEEDEKVRGAQIKK